MMQITRRSVASGIVRTKHFDITWEQYNSWMLGKLIQDAFPNLSESDREFIKTGITEEEWVELFGNGDEEADE